MRNLQKIYVRLVQPSCCFVAYVWVLEFQSVYDPGYDSFLDSLADCGAIFWCAIVTVAIAYIPIAILASGWWRSIVYLNQLAIKLCLLLVTYFYFRRWLDRWVVTDLDNTSMTWVMAGSMLLLVSGALGYWRYGRGRDRFRFPDFEDCFLFGVIPILCASALVLSIKVTSHLNGTRPSGVAAPVLSPAENRAAQSRPNIILIAADALREQSVSPGREHNNSSTPFLRKLTMNSSVYEQMHSNAMSTRAAITTILSGKHPLSHGNLTRKVGRYDSDQNLLRLLRDNGYTTVAITSNGEAANVVSPLARFLSRPHFPESGSELLSKLRRIGVYPTVAGAAMYRDLYLMRRFVRFETIDLPHGYADETLDLAQRILSDIPQPFFLFVHVHEPHVPYYALLPRESGDLNRKRLTIDREIAPDFTGYYPALKQSIVDGYRAHYEESLRFLDFELERFVDTLDRRGLSKNLLFLVVSDHGESFDRGYLTGC